MRGTMDLQSSRLAESLAADLTLEWLLLGVDESVISEMVLSSECLLADLARVRSLIRVRALVDQQVVRLGEVSLAELADELLLGSIGSSIASLGSGKHEPWSIIGIDEGSSSGREEGEIGRKQTGTKEEGRRDKIGSRHGTRLLGRFGLLFLLDGLGKMGKVEFGRRGRFGLDRRGGERGGEKRVG